MDGLGQGCGALHLLLGRGDREDEVAAVAGCERVVEATFIALGGSTGGCRPAGGAGEATMGALAVDMVAHP